MDGHVYGALGQPGVGLLMAIVIGALAGWLAERFMNSNMGLLGNIVLGIIGGVVGNFLAAQFHIPIFGFWRNLFSATIGAVIVIAVVRAVRGERRY